MERVDDAFGFRSEADNFGDGIPIFGLFCINAGQNDTKDLTSTQVMLSGVNGYGHYHYYLTDHLGYNCVVINGNDSVEQVTHYYPFGTVYADAGTAPDF